MDDDPIKQVKESIDELLETPPGERPLRKRWSLEADKDLKEVWSETDQLIQDLRACALPEGEDGTNIRDLRVRGVLAELLSQMFDNEDAHGIYPTSKFMWMAETFILNLLAQTRDGWEADRMKLYYANDNVALADGHIKRRDAEIRRLKEQVAHLKHVRDHGGDEPDGSCHCAICKGESIEVPGQMSLLPNEGNQDGDGNG